MLRWREGLRIGLCADRVIWVRLGAGLRPRVIEKRVIPVATEDRIPAWMPAIDTLKETLQAARDRPTEANVILSNRFVRYAVVPWHASLMKRDERLAQARHCFKEIYGDMAASWSVTLSEGAYGKPVLASAVEGELLTGLRQAFSAARIRLAAIEPYLTAAYTRFRGKIKPQRDTACFGVIEPHDLSVLVLKGSTLDSALHHRVHDDWRRELQGIQLQLASDSGAPDSRPCYVFAPEEQAADTTVTGGFTRLSLAGLPGYAPGSDAAVAMALVGR